ncbi:hypothetical protein V6Z11_A11G338700 [Gossypium hirsutum]
MQLYPSNSVMMYDCSLLSGMHLSMFSEITEWFDQPSVKVAVTVCNDPKSTGTRKPTKNLKHQHQKERRKSSRTKTGELRLVEVKCPGSASKTIPTPTQSW